MKSSEGGKNFTGAMVERSVTRWSVVIEDDRNNEVTRNAILEENNAECVTTAVAALLGDSLGT